MIQRRDCIGCQACADLCPKNAIVFGLFNSWKVNGKYSFIKPDHEEINKHKRYCKRSYERYFNEANKRIEDSRK